MKLHSSDDGFKKISLDSNDKRNILVESEHNIVANKNTIISIVVIFATIIVGVYFVMYN